MHALTVLLSLKLITIKPIVAIPLVGISLPLLADASRISFSINNSVLYNSEQKT